MSILAVVIVLLHSLGVHAGNAVTTVVDAGRHSGSAPTKPPQTQRYNSPIASGETASRHPISTEGRAFIPGARATPSWSPGETLMAYEIHDGDEYPLDDGDLWISSPDGRNAKRLGGEGLSDWSPDGSLIAYWVRDGMEYSNGRTGYLWISSRDGKARKLLASRVWSYDWSPDGKRLVYKIITDVVTLTTEDGTEYSDFIGELWVWSVDTDEAARVTDEDSWNWEWSPDGRWLSYALHEVSDDDTYLEQLWIWPRHGLDANGKSREARWLADGVLEWEWAPGRSHLAYTVRNSGPNGGTALWVATSIGTIEQLAVGDIWDWHWSPASDAIAFVDDNDELDDQWFPTGSDLWVASVERRLNSIANRTYRLVGNVSDWDWSPDGNRLAYLKGDYDENHRDGELWIVSRSGDDPQFVASRIYGKEWQWSPDGTSLAYLVDDGEADGSFNLPDDGDLWVWTVGRNGSDWLAGDVGWIDWSPDGRRLAYSVSGSSPGWHPRETDGVLLWVWQAEESRHELVSRHASYWEWSPTGSLLAHYKATEGGHSDVISVGSDFGELWVWSSDGKSNGLLATKVDRIVWDWSPSGGYLAYGDDVGVFVTNVTAMSLQDMAPVDEVDADAEADDDSELTEVDYCIGFTRHHLQVKRIFLMKADGTGERRLTYGFADDPAWSPDGKAVAFAGDPRALGSGPNEAGRHAAWPDPLTEIFVAAADGSNQQQVTHIDGWSRDPVWSPDGSRIAFTYDDGRSSKIMIVDRDGHNLRELASGSEPVWSPDGTLIAFGSTYTGSSEVVVMSVDNTNRQVLASGSSPVWSPDGGRIAFLHGPNQILSVVEIDGSKEDQLAHAGSSNMWKPAWSPDGTQIAYTRSFVDGRNEIWSAQFQGDTVKQFSLLVDDGWGPMWSPDATRLTFTRAEGRQHNIFLTDVRSHRVRRLTLEELEEDVRWSVPYVNEGGVWSPDGEYVAYTSDRLGENEIVVTGNCRGGPDSIVGLGHDGWGATWSPDGTRVAFLRGDPDDTPTRVEILVMNADGTGLRQITRSDGTSLPAWSPDSRRIAFSAVGPSGNREVFAVGIDGSGRRQLTRTEREDDVDEYGPVWSPSGRRIAFVRSRWHTDVDSDTSTYSSAIVVMEASGAGQRQLTGNAGNGHSPVWSPDGCCIAFTESSNGFSNIAVVGVNDGAQRTVIQGEDYHSTGLAWSPDGARIAFTRSDQSGHDIYVVDLDDKRVEQLTHTRDSAGPVWSPDGSHIVYWRGTIMFDYIDASVHVMRADGANQRKISGEGSFNAWGPVWLGE